MSNKGTQTVLMILAAGAAASILSIIIGLIVIAMRYDGQVASSIVDTFRTIITGAMTGVGSIVSMLMASRQVHKAYQNAAQNTLNTSAAGGSSAP